VAHDTCHLERDEHKAYEALHGLTSVLVGDPHRLIALSDLEALAEPIGALLLELPQRRIGGQLPRWEELAALSGWAKARGVALHLDGARLWECQPFYARSYREIAAPFDTVYVSFYKLLGAIAGAALAGPADLIAEARIWQRRHGGNLVHLYPYVLSAKAGLAERLGKIGLYCEKARSLAAALGQIPGVSLLPDPPHTNAMKVYLRGERGRLTEEAAAIERQCDIRLFDALFPAEVPGYTWFELTVGDATLEVPTEEAAGLFRRLVG
jgi:threonine aldolase